MTLIQLLLILLISLSGIFYLLKLRNNALDKIIVLIFFISGTFLIIFPDASHVIANFFGVGRGADLIFYFSILGALFLFILMYTKIKKLEGTITQLSRYIALDQIRKKED